VGTVEPTSNNGGDEELRAVSVFASIRHGQKSGLSVLEFEVLVSKLLAVDGLAASSVVAGEVATLKHELGNDTMEFGTRISVSILTGTQLAEVSRGPWYVIIVELEGDALCIPAADGDVEVTVCHDG